MSFEVKQGKYGWLNIEYVGDIRVIFSISDIRDVSEERWWSFAGNIRDKKSDILEFIAEDNFCEGEVSIRTANGDMQIIVSKSHNLGGGGAIHVTTLDAHTKFCGIISQINFEKLMSDD
jgi:hypothetical protein